MLEFRTWLEANEKIPDGAIKIHLPHGRMQRQGSCGAMAFRAVCRLFNVGPEDESDFMKMLGTTENGTWPENIVKKAKELGFQVKAKTNMELDELISCLNMGMPVICAMQAWGTPKYYETDESGHYVVAIGYDKNNIYFEDPSIPEKRGVLPIKEFIKRWHDKDAHGTVTEWASVCGWTLLKNKTR